MEFTINREIFLNGIQKTLGIIEKSIAVPILQNILIRTMEGDNAIEILATNREISIRTDYDASVIKQGQLTLPAKKLNELLKELEGETVHIAVKGKRVCVITCNKVVCKINGMDADDFPAAMDIDGNDPFNFSSVLFSDMARKVLYAVSKDESRKNVSGIHMQKINDGNIIQMRMAATDGHRLAVAYSGENLPDFMRIPDKGVIIPRKGFSEIRKIAEDTEGIVRIGFTKSACIVEAGRVALRVGLIDDTYPDISRVIPDENADGIIHLAVSREAILHALRRMAVYGDGCVMDIRGGAVHFEASDPEIGEIKDQIGSENLAEEVEKTVKFNIRYLTEAIEAVSGKKVVLNIHDKTGPCVVHDEEDKNYTAVVMPLKG